jgi:hypothetical protein
MSSRARQLLPPDELPVPPVVTSVFGAQRMLASRTREFGLEAKYNTCDIQPDEAVRLNNGESYMDRLGREERYIVPVPWDPFIYGEFKEIRLDFTLPSEMMTLTDFVNLHKIAHGGASPVSDYKPIEMVIPKARIAELLDLPRNLSNHHGYHVIPLHIEVVDVHSSLPVSLSVDFMSTRAKASTFKTWQKQSYILAPDAKAVPRRTGLLYAAPEELNHEDCSRFLVADFTHMASSFNQLKVVNQEGVVAVVIACPQPTDTNMTDVSFWFMVSYFDEIVKATDEFGNQMGKNTSLFNKVATGTGGSNSCVWVIKKVLMDLLQAKALKFARDELLMNIDAFKLVCTPLLKHTGWDELARIAAARCDEVAVHTKNRDVIASLRVSIKLVAHVYTDRQALAEA